MWQKIIDTGIGKHYTSFNKYTPYSRPWSEKFIYSIPVMYGKVGIFSASGMAFMNQNI